MNSCRAGPPMPLGEEGIGHHWLKNTVRRRRFSTLFGSRMNLQPHQKPRPTLSPAHSCAPGHSSPPSFFVTPHLLNHAGHYLPPRGKCAAARGANFVLWILATLDAQPGWLRGSPPRSHRRLHQAIACAASCMDGPGMASDAPWALAGPTQEPASRKLFGQFA